MPLFSGSRTLAAAASTPAASSAPAQLRSTQTPRAKGKRAGDEALAWECAPKRRLPRSMCTTNITTALRHACDAVVVGDCGSFAELLQRCRAAERIGVAMVWDDGSTNFDPQRRRKGGVKTNAERERSPDAQPAFVLLRLDGSPATTIGLVLAGREIGGWAAFEQVLVCDDLEKVILDAGCVLREFYKLQFGTEASASKERNLTDPRVQAHLDAGAIGESLHFEALLTAAKITHPVRLASPILSCVSSLDKVLDLASSLGAAFTAEQSSLFALEMELLPILALMEETGLACDVNILTRVRAGLQNDMAELNRRGCSIAGADFNLASNQQCADVLFKKLRLRPPPSLTQTAAKKHFAVTAEVLEALNHPLARIILQSRKKAKMLGTYIDGLVAKVQSDGVIRAQWHQLRVATGQRAHACSHPDMQPATDKRPCLPTCDQDASPRRTQTSRICQQREKATRCVLYAARLSHMPARRGECCFHSIIASASFVSLPNSALTQISSGRLKRARIHMPNSLQNVRSRAARPK